MDMKNKGLILVLATSIISGFSIFLNAFAVKGFDSSVFTFSKNVLVAVFIFSIILLIRKFSELRKLTRKQWVQLTIVGLVGGSIPFILFFKGLQMTTGATSGFIYKTLFVYATVFAVLFLKEKISKGLIAGVALLMIGTYVFARPELSFSTGHLLVFGSTLLWAAENVYSKHMLKKLSGNIVAFGRMFFGSAFIFIFLAFTSKASLIVSMTSQQYLWILLTSALLLAYVMTFYNGLKTVKVSTATSILAMGAPITFILGAAFSGAAVTLLDAVGTLIMLIGIVLVIWSSQVYSGIMGKLKRAKNEWR